MLKSYGVGWGGGPWDFSVSQRPLGFGFLCFWAKGLGPGLDNRNWAKDTVTFCSYYKASISDVCRAEKLWLGAHSYSRMWGIKILESLRILIRILSLVHYHGGLISDDYVIKIIINVLLGTSLGSGPDGDCEFWTIKTLMGDPGHRRGNSDLRLVQIVKPSQSLCSHTLTFNYFGKNRRKCPWFTPSPGQESQ